MGRGLSPDARLLVNPLRTTFHVLVWDLDTGELVADLDDLVEATRAAPRETLRMSSDAEFTPDGSRLVVPTYLGTVGIWESETWDLVTLIDPESGFRDIDFLDDRIAVTLQRDGTLTLRDARDFEILAGPVQAFAEANAHGGRVVAIADDSSVVVASTITGAHVHDGRTLEPIGDPSLTSPN